MNHLEYIARIFPFLNEPLPLIGFVLLLFFGVLLSLIKYRVVLPTSGRAERFKVIHLLLSYGFVIVLTVILLAFSFEFFKTHRETIPPVKKELIKNPEVPNDPKFPNSLDPNKNYKQKLEIAVKKYINSDDFKIYRSVSGDCTRIKLVKVSESMYKGNVTFQHIPEKSIIVTADEDRFYFELDPPEGTTNFKSKGEGKI